MGIFRFYIRSRFQKALTLRYITIISKCCRNFWIWDNIQIVAHIANIQRLAGGPEQNYFDTIFSPNILYQFTTKLMGANIMIPILSLHFVCWIIHTFQAKTKAKHPEVTIKGVLTTDSHFLNIFRKILLFILQWPRQY